MNSQIFKEPIPYSIAQEFLSKNCLVTNKFYYFTMDAFKKAQYNNSLKEFLEACEPHYHLSKRKKYLTKETFNATVTILRQIYNFLKIPFSSKIKYAHSSYTIDYFFSINENAV